MNRQDKLVAVLGVAVIATTVILPNAQAFLPMCVSKVGSETSEAVWWCRKRETQCDPENVFANNYQWKLQVHKQKWQNGYSYWCEGPNYQNTCCWLQQSEPSCPSNTCAPPPEL
jgi:hypothetical protein